MIILGAEEARRLAVAAGSGRCRPGSDAVLRDLGLLQLDPLTRVDKAHRLTCLARMPDPASAGDVDAPLWPAGEAASFETWVHAVCLVPVEDWPLLRVHRDRIRELAGGPPPSLLRKVRQVVADSPDGVTISDVEDRGRRTSGWEWSERKHAVEYMLRSGDLVCTARSGPKRVYDLPERRIPERYLADGGASTAELLAAIALRAIRAMAVATTGDVSRYYNISVEQALLGLRLAGVPEVTVDGWDEGAWMDVASPERPPPRDPVLIGPFDNLIWDRKRTRRVLGFDYIFEAYKPQSRRVYGYYVMAVLDNDRLTGRADLKREAGRLEVLAGYPEPGEDPDGFSESLNAAVERLQRQLSR
jgi:uncharacterized protein YcaQ